MNDNTRDVVVAALNEWLVGEHGQEALSIFREGSELREGLKVRLGLAFAAGIDFCSSILGKRMATVREIDGQVVLDDPEAIGVWRAVQKHNCKLTFAANADRVRHFSRRIVELDKSPSDAVIVIINADDIRGGPMAGILVPTANWNEIRERGEVPFARGLAERSSIQLLLEALDSEAAAKLREHVGIAVVVIDHQVAEVFSA